MAAQAWIAKIKDKQKQEEFFKLLANQRSGAVLTRLVEILDSKRKGMTKLPRGLDDFDTPSWHTKEAYRVGYLSALEEVINLLKE